MPEIHELIRRIPNGITVVARLSIITICIYVMMQDRGVVNKMLDLFSMTRVKATGFEETLERIGMDGYAGHHALEARQGKNVIIIFLESYERGYLSDKMAHLTPNMRSLMSEWTYYDMRPSPGSEWSNGSLYTCLTGFPSFFDSGVNATFQPTYHSDITGISHIFKKAGYEMTNIIKNAQFTGTQEMLHAFQFNNIIDQSVLDEKTRDKDLFERAKMEIRLKIKQKAPFALFLSTLDTHFPAGNYDKRMEAYISPKNSDLEFMVAAVDHMIGDFVGFLQKENVLSNTTLFIIPDHLKMGSASIFEGTGKRSLYIITNALYENFSVTESDTLYQIDMPKIILDGAAIRHNATFLTDYIPKDKMKFLIANKFLITSLNVSGINRINHKNTYRIPVKTRNYSEYAKDTSRFIAHAGGMINGDIYTNSLEALNHSYAKGFRLFELDIIKTADGQYVAAHDWEGWSRITGYKGDLPVSKEEFLKHKILKTYSPMDMTMINSWFKEHEDAMLVTDKINEPRKFADEFIDKKRLMMELFSLEAVKEGLEAGIKAAMPSQIVIKDLKGDKVAALKKLGVTDIAVSRSDIPEDYQFFKKLKENEIKAWVFHINFDKEKDEEYVVKYEMDYIYGIYADKWDFGTN